MFSNITTYQGRFVKSQYQRKIAFNNIGYLKIADSQNLFVSKKNVHSQLNLFWDANWIANSPIKTFT